MGFWSDGGATLQRDCTWEDDGEGAWRARETVTALGAGQERGFGTGLQDRAVTCVVYVYM